VCFTSIIIDNDKFSEEINENTVENSSAEEIGGNAENEVAEEVDEIIEENQEDQSGNFFLNVKMFKIKN